MTFTEHVLPYIAIADGECQIVTDGSALELEKLPTSVVFLHAIWSGPSVKSLKSYAAAFAELQLHRTVKFYIVNFDSLSHGFFEKLPGEFGGNGETFFVLEGKVVGYIPHFSEDFSSQLKDALGSE